MTFHLGAFAQSVNPANVYTQVNAVQDAALTTNGAYLYVPTGLNNLLGAAAVINGTAAGFAKISSPSLRAINDFQIRPVNQGLVFEDPIKAQMQPTSPFPLVVNEGLEFDVKTTPGAGVEHYGLVWLGDGAIKPANGNMVTISATSAASLSANTWVNSNLTLAETLPYGTYQVVGLRCESTNGVAARLVFVGGTFRPGVPVVADESDLDLDIFRNGGFGVFGQFDSTTPPTIDVLGITDTTQNVFLDLIKIK